VVEAAARPPCHPGNTRAQVAELFLNEQPVDADTLRAAIRRATLALKFQPVLMGSAFKNKGVYVCVCVA